MAVYEGDERRDSHWHLDKRLNVGHLLTTFTFAASIVLWAVTIETRLVEQIEQVRSLEDKVSSIRASNDKSMDRVLLLVDKMNDKLDRIIERGLK